LVLWEAGGATAAVDDCMVRGDRLERLAPVIDDEVPDEHALAAEPGLALAVL